MSSPESSALEGHNQDIMEKSSWQGTGAFGQQTGTRLSHFGNGSSTSRWPHPCLASWLQPYDRLSQSHPAKPLLDSWLVVTVWDNTHLLLR